MSPEDAGTVVAVLVGILAIGGALWRFVVLPNLREQLFGPIRETHRQVTENAHANVEPTVLDLLDDLRDQVKELSETTDAIGLTQSAVLRIAQRIRRLEERLNDHETWAGEEDRFLRALLTTLLHEGSNKRKEPE